MPGASSATKYLRDEGLRPAISFCRSRRNICMASTTTKRQRLVYIYNRSILLLYRAALAPPVLSDVVEAVNYFREIRRLIQEILEVLHRVFLGEIQ